MIRELSNYEVHALHYELLMKDIVAAAEKLPPFPDIVWRVMSLVRKDAPTSEIEKVIACDQAISAQILRLGSSTRFSRRRDQPCSLQEAILLIGSKMLMQVVIAACASRYYLRSADRDGIERELWEHSLSSGLMSGIISRWLRHKQILSIYTASLFHDLGKTVLNTYARIYLNTSLRQLIGDNLGTGAERRALGIDHQELGGMIARNWNFPAVIVSAIEHHHNPQNAGTNRDVASIVYMTNELVAAATVRNKPLQNRKAFDPETDGIFRDFGITRETADQFLADFAKSMEAMKKVISG